MTQHVDTASANPTHMINAQGHMVPIALVKPEDKLEDEMVNKVFGYADELSAQIGRFKGHTFDDVVSLNELLAQEYGKARGGPKGNMDFLSYDGLRKVSVRIQTNMTFGPQLQIAKSLIDECIEEWGDGARDELRALVNHAFDVRKTGNVNRDALLGLRRLDIKHPKWEEAMRAITASIRHVGSKAHIRIYARETTDQAFEMVQLNIAKL